MRTFESDPCDGALCRYGGFQEDGSIQARPLSLSHELPHGAFSQTRTHKPGGTPGQGLQIKGMSKGTVTVKGQRGRRRERADWIKKIKQGHR